MPLCSRRSCAEGKGEYRKELAEFRRRAIQRVKVDGTFYEIADVPALDKKFKHDIDVVVDRVVVRTDIGARLADSLEQALKLADGLAVAEFADAAPADRRRRIGQQATQRNAERLLFSEKFACPVSGFTIPEIEPRLFSFNNPFGACPKCDGLGVEQHIDADLVIPDKERTLRAGAIAPWAKIDVALLRADARRARQALPLHARRPSGRTCRRRRRTRSCTAPATTEIRFSYDDGLRAYETKRPFEGVITNLERRWSETDSDWVREEIERYFTDVPCAACHGYRLKPEALCVKIGGKHIGEVSELSIRGAARWFDRAARSGSPPSRTRSPARILKEIRERLKFLVDVGLDYLTLARASGTLSGGESQRIRLASQIGSGLTGVLYVLDEPSIGLHQRDNARLLETLQAPARPRQHRDRGRARRGRDPAPPTTSSTSGPAPASMAAISSPRARRPTSWPTRTRSPASISPACARSPMPERRPNKPHARAAARRRARQQPEERHGRDPARPVHLRHRRLRRRQVDAADRHALQGAGAPAQRRARAPCPASTASRASSTSTRSSTSTSRRSAARRARTRRPTPAPSRRSANGSPACRKRRRAATSPAASPSTSRAAAARPARATASSRSRCTSCPTSTSPATSARASATTARRWRCSSRASRSPTCST